MEFFSVNLAKTTHNHFALEAGCNYMMILLNLKMSYFLKIALASLTASLVNIGKKTASAL